MRVKSGTHPAVAALRSRTREVRRLCEAVGLEVLRLVRTSFGPVRLGDLEPGAYRALTNKERDLVLAITKTPSGND